MRAANHKSCCTESAANVQLQNARPTHCRCVGQGHSGPLTLITVHFNYSALNRVDEVESSEVITTNISDHYPVFAREKFPTLPEDSISINYRVFSNENLSIIKKSCEDINWSPVLINDDADEAYDLFQSTLLSVFNEHFPIHTKNISIVVGKVNLGLLLVY